MAVQAWATQQLRYSIELIYTFLYYYYLHRKAEENRQQENAAAIKIQSWFRGCQVRAYLR